MFRFDNINFLYLLILIPFLILVYIILRISQRRRMNRYADAAFFEILMPLRSETRRTFKFILNLFALTGIIIALARPQFGSKLEQVKRQGIELVIALDVSRSMLAEDIKPNRLERAKQAIITLINRMENDKIGLIVFGGDAYTQLPITNDFVSAKLFLSNVNTDMVSRQGTAIASAISLGSNSFTPDDKASKVIVLLSDGEDHEGEAIEKAKEAAKKGIKIYTIGMGSPFGTPIPTNNNGGFLKDHSGNVVMSKMDPKMLSEVAEVGGGEFFTASTGNVGLNQLYDQLNKLQKSETESNVYSEYNDQYQYFIAFSIIMLALDFLILEKKNLKFKNFTLFGNS